VPLVSASNAILTVLMVEDSLAVRQAMRAAFEGIPGVRVVGEAEDARRAMRLLRELRPDVLTLDVRLKESYGTEVLRELAKDQMPKKPVIMILTNHVNPYVRSAFRDLGADHFLDKATEFGTACGILERLVAERRNGEARHGS